MSETINHSRIEANPAQKPLCPLCQAELPADGKPLAQVTCPSCGKEVMMPGMIGNYRIVRLLGAGGMGAVYEGFDEGLLRKVAVKVILKEKAQEDPAFIESFRHEAQSAAQLNSPNIVQIYAFGDVRGQPYIAMELVAANSLDRMMKAGRVPPHIAMSIGRQIALALKAASTNGIVHGDVKPENILINASDEAKLADFGIAALAGSSAAAKNEVWGTPYYIAPETLRRQKVDLRADIYSLGGTLYHAMAGQPPFEGKDSVEVMKERLVRMPEPLNKIAPEVSEEINKIVMRMLDPDPMRRYPNYESLLSDMTHVVPGMGSVKGRKRIVIKGVTSAQSIKNSSRIVDVSKVETFHDPAHAPEKKSNNAMIFLIIGLVSVAVLIGGIIAALVSVASKSDKPVSDVPASSAPATPQATVDPALIAAQDALKKAVSEFDIAPIQARAKEATTLIGRIERNVKRGLSPEQQSSIPPTEPPVSDYEPTAPVGDGTITLTAPEGATPLLTFAYAQYSATYSLKAAAKDADALSVWLQTQIPLVEAPDLTTDQAVALSEAVNKALETFNKRASIAKGDALLKQLQRNVTQSKRLADQAREEMEIAAKQRLKEAEQKAAEEREHQAEAARQQQIQREIESVAGAAQEAKNALNDFDCAKANKVFEARTRHVKSKDALEAKKIILEQIERMNNLKTFFIKTINAGNGKAWHLAHASANTVTLNGEPVAWSELTQRKPALLFGIIRNYIASDDNTQQMLVSDRAELCINAVLFCDLYITSESKTVTETVAKMKVYAIGKIPSTAKTFERLLPEEEASSTETTSEK